MNEEKASKPTRIEKDLKNLSSHLRKQNETLKKLLEELSADKKEDSE